MGASLRICDVSCVHNSGKEDCMRVLRVGALLDSLRCDTPCRSRRPHGNSTKPNDYIWLHKGAGVRDEHRGNLGHSFHIGLANFSSSFCHLSPVEPFLPVQDVLFLECVQLIGGTSITSWYSNVTIPVPYYKASRESM
jgi:hypothetical protein